MVPIRKFRIYAAFWTQIKTYIKVKKLPIKRIPKIFQKIAKNASKYEKTVGIKRLKNVKTV